MKRAYKEIGTGIRGMNADRKKSSEPSLNLIQGSGLKRLTRLLNPLNLVNPAYLVIIMVLTLTVQTALAQGGTTGPLTWQLTGTAPNYTLTISGEGKMPDYYSGAAPWWSYSLSITTVVIGNGVTSIGNYAFGNYIITSVTIPNSVTSIGIYAFYGCSSLTSITNLNPVPVNINGLSVSNGVNQSACTLYVPVNSVSAYQNAAVWQDFNVVGLSVGIEGTEEGANFSVYPNPASTHLTLHRSTSEKAQVEIYNSAGTLMPRVEISGTLQAVDISTLSAGVYVVRLVENSGVSTKQFIKE